MTITAKALFQSSPAPSHHAAPPRHRSFNPHLHRGAGAACYRQERRDAVEVSILTRTEVRVLRYTDCTDNTARLFQSSPAPRYGCCHSRIQAYPSGEGVSILTRTEVRVLRTRTLLTAKLSVVSILTRTEVRVLQEAHGRLAIMVLFQSSPAPRYGCCSSLLLMWLAT